MTGDAGDTDAAAVGFNQGPHNGKAKADTGGWVAVTAAAAVGAIEAIEEVWQVLGVDAGAGILDTETEKLPVMGLCAKGDRPPPAAYGAERCRSGCRGFAVAGRGRHPA